MVASVQNPAPLNLGHLGGSAPRSADGRSAERAGSQPLVRDQEPSADLTSASTLVAVRDGLARALGALDLALAGGRSGLDALNEGRDDPEAALRNFSAIIDDAINAGASLLKGETLRAPLEPGQAPFELPGEDVRVSPSATFDEAALQNLTERLSAALERFNGASTRLETHSSLVARLDSAVAGVLQPSLDAEAARLTALQVSQGLAERSDGFGAGAPKALLSLFRS